MFLRVQDLRLSGTRIPYLLRTIPAATVRTSFPIHFRVSAVDSGVSIHATSSWLTNLPSCMMSPMVQPAFLCAALQRLLSYPSCDGYDIWCLIWVSRLDFQRVGMQVEIADAQRQDGVIVEQRCKQREGRNTILFRISCHLRFRIYASLA